MTTFNSQKWRCTEQCTAGAGLRGAMLVCTWAAKGSELLSMLSAMNRCTQSLTIQGVYPPALKLTSKHTFGQTLIRYGCPPCCQGVLKNQKIKHPWYLSFVSLGFQHATSLAYICHAIHTSVEAWCLCRKHVLCIRPVCPCRQSKRDDAGATTACAFDLALTLAGFQGE